MISRRAPAGSLGIPLGRRLLGGLLALPALRRAAAAGPSLADFGWRGDGADASAALARALAAAAATGAEVTLPAGTIMVTEAPGTVTDPAAHGVPTLRHPVIRLRGAGAGRTRLLSRPRPTPANRALAVSAPILKSEGALRFELSGVTLDGGIRELAPGLRRGADPWAAALLEVRGARSCLLRDVVLTGFAGHWDVRAPEEGNYGRRGPLLVAGCAEVELLDIVLRHPTFREGAFVHSPGRLLVRGFRLEGPGPGEGRAVSTPLHVTGPGTGEVTIEDFATAGRWDGSLMNLGGPGRFALRGIRAQGGAGAAPWRSRPGEPVPEEAGWGKGLDIGSEVNEHQFPGQPGTAALRLEDVRLRAMRDYAIKARRSEDSPLRLLSLGPGVEVEGGVEALQALWVSRIEGRLAARGLGRFTGGRPGGVAVLLARCGEGRLEVALEGMEANLGVLRTASPRLVLSGRVAGFPAGALRDEVPEGEDARWDALCERLEVLTAGAGPALRLGTSPARRLRLAALRGCLLDGAPIRPGDPQLRVAAVEMQLG